MRLRRSAGLASAWRGVAERRTAAHIALAVLLLPFSVVYRWLAALDRFRWESGLAHPLRLPSTVVSVGGIEVGGVGKTPVTIWLARRLAESGLSVAVVARNLGARRAGHGPVPVDRVLSVARTTRARDMFSDEVLLLAGSLPGVSVYAGRSKSAAAARADVILIDDGF